MNSPEPGDSPDGLDRFIITPAVKASDDAPLDSDPMQSSESARDGESEEEAAASTTTTSQPADDMPTLSLGIDPDTGEQISIDRQLLEALPDSKELVIRGGAAGYMDDDGDFVALSGQDGGESMTDEPMTDELGPTEPSPSLRWTLTSTETQDPADPAIGLLQQLDGVVSVVAIGDGSYAVATDDPDVIVPSPRATNRSRPGADLGDRRPATGLRPPTRTAPYQWAIDNTGDNLASVQNPAPAQVADADVDGLEAAAGPTGAGVVVAVIDSGVDFSHPDLAGQSWVNPGETCDNSIDDDGNGFVDDCAGWDFGYEDNVPWSPSNQDHRTHVAGIIAASAGNGVGVTGLAPSAAIMDLSVDGPGGISTSSVARAIRYAVDNGADVINMSLGPRPVRPLLRSSR